LKTKHLYSFKDIAGIDRWPRQEALTFVSGGILLQVVDFVTEDIPPKKSTFVSQ